MQNVPRTTITKLALQLATVEDVAQLGHILPFTLGEAGISGMVLALSPYLTDTLSSASVELVIPDQDGERAKLLPYKVREPHLLPKQLLPVEKRFTATLELLFYHEKYIGYMYLFAQGTNSTLYEQVRALVSQTLYRLYLRDGKTKPHALIVTDRTALLQKVPLAAPQKWERPGKLTAQDITDYLIDHLDELCDLDKMAAHFQMSKSHLTRRVKALTGYSAQTLHERLKIEQAKDFIAGGAMKMNDIAARLGYTNPNYFSNVFKKVTGLSPLAWAEQNRPVIP